MQKLESEFDCRHTENTSLGAKRMRCPFLDPDNLGFRRSAQFVLLNSLSLSPYSCSAPRIPTSATCSYYTIVMLQRELIRPPDPTCQADDVDYGLRFHCSTAALAVRCKATPQQLGRKTQRKISGASCIYKGSCGD